MRKNKKSKSKKSKSKRGKSKKGKSKMAECKQGTQENNKGNKVKDQPDTNKGDEQAQDNTSVGGEPGQNNNSGKDIQDNGEGTQSNWKSFLCKLRIIGIIGIISGIILSNLFGSFVGICLAVSLCICAIVFCYYAYKCLQKDKLSCTISWLVGLSLLFVLIIVIGLFASTFSGFSVTVEGVGNFKGSTITLTSVLLFILSIFISTLSGYIVYKKDEEKKQKQRDMAYDIEDALKKLYKKGK